MLNMLKSQGLLVAQLFLVYIVSFPSVSGMTGESWKDSWIHSFQQRCYHSTLTGCNSSTSGCEYRIPQYLPPRTTANYTQLIPKVIFQTWKSDIAAGKHQYDAVLSYINDNPEYEYYLFDDLFNRIVPGAMRADLWRLAVIYRYGGVYFDADSRSAAPLHSFIWPNASVVTGLGVSADFHQWALLYTPRHVIIKSCLKIAFHRLKHVYSRGKGGKVSQTTGPAALHVGVTDTLRKSGCHLQLPSRAEVEQMHKQQPVGSLLQHSPDYYCDPEVGILQIFTHDFLGGNVVFKASQAEAEMSQVSVHYRVAQAKHETLFSVG